VSEGEGAHLGWVVAHPARARQRVRAARVFISPEGTGVPDLLVIGGGRRVIRTWSIGRNFLSIIK
jgi:hypothetical protein